MKEKVKTVQFRSTIFLQQNIGYTPDSANEFKNLLMPESLDVKVYGIPQLSVPVVGVNPNTPQYGMPWRLFTKTNSGEYNVAFQPGKIDIILAIETVYNEEIERDFCNKCVEWFSKILSTGKSSVTRVAYAPSYAINDLVEGENSIWNSLLKKTVIEGIQTQDVNLNFLLKKEMEIGGGIVQVNLLHNILDGFHTKVDGTVEKVLLFQLDLNTIPEVNVNLNQEGLSEFYSKILKIKSNLVDNVTE